MSSDKSLPLISLHTVAYRILFISLFSDGSTVNNVWKYVNRSKLMLQPSAWCLHVTRYAVLPITNERFIPFALTRNRKSSLWSIVTCLLFILHLFDRNDVVVSYPICRPVCPIAAFRFVDRSLRLCWNRPQSIWFLPDTMILSTKKKKQRFSQTFITSSPDVHCILAIHFCLMAER